MKGKRWTLVAYDITEKKRLSRVHYFVRTRLLRLQRSVYIINANRSTLKKLKSGIRARIDRSDDDVRLYPVRSPDDIWIAGHQEGLTDALFAEQMDTNKRPAKRSGLLSKVTRLFTRSNS